MWRNVMLTQQVLTDKENFPVTKNSHWSFNPKDFFCGSLEPKNRSESSQVYVWEAMTQ